MTPEIRMEILGSSNPRVLSLCFSPLSNSSRILPTVSLYLVSLHSFRSGNDFYQVTGRVRILV